MRYTRYNHNKRRGMNGGKGSFITSLVVIVIIAIVLGVFVGKVIFNEGLLPFGANSEKESGEKVVPDSDKDTQVNKGEENKELIKEVYYLQCGVFTAKEGADATLGKIPTGFNAFIIEDDGKFKVLVGVFIKDEVEKKSSELTAVEIANVKIRIGLEGSTTEDKLKIEIIDGYVKILSKLNEKDVKSFNTNEFKAWLNTNTQNIKSDDKELNILIESVRNLQEVITKEQGLEINKVIYDVVKKYKI